MAAAAHGFATHVKLFVVLQLTLIGKGHMT